MDNEDKAYILSDYFGYLPAETEVKIHYDWLLENMWRYTRMIEEENNVPEE